MARPKRSSVTLQKAEKRQAGLQSIDLALNLGNDLTLAAYTTLIETLRSQIVTYNSALSTLDDQLRQIKDTEHQLRNLSEQMLLGVAARYGKNSREYGMAGGVPKSERRRPVRQNATQSSGATLQSLAITSSTNEKNSDPTNGNNTGNGNGKAIVA